VLIIVELVDEVTQLFKLEIYMKQCLSNNSCETESTCHQGESCVMEEIHHLAKCAKHELLKEKMKKHFEAKIGKKLDKVAEVVVDAVLARMQHKKADKQACEQFEEDLSSAYKA